MTSKKTETKIKYFAYVRKSTEGNEQQALSIDAQKDEIEKRFKGLDIEYVEEKKSAFKINNRPAFSEMIMRIDRGERTGLIAWHPNRLSRNEIEASQISYRARTKAIADLRFCSYDFKNDDHGIFFLQFAMSQSQLESASKGTDVKRGLARKVTMGYPPTHAPLGYRNTPSRNKGAKIWVKDQKRFGLVREMFEMVLEGTKTPAQIHREIVDRGKLNMPDGKPVGRSTFYRILNDPTYTGEFEYPRGSGEWHKGSYTPLLTVEEYDRIQKLLGKKAALRPRRYHFTYRGPLVCGECGASITAERKFKRQKNGNTHEYVYYHCTKKKDPDCSQGSIEEKQLESQMSEVLKSIEIAPEFKDWALKVIKKQNKQESAKRNKTIGAQRREYDKVMQKLDNLIDMRAAQEITEDDFARRKKSLTKEKSHLEAIINDAHEQGDEWIAAAERCLHFAERASSAFKNGDTETKKTILSGIGSNLSLKDKKLSIVLPKPLSQVEKAVVEVNAIHERFEPQNKTESKGYFGDLYTQNPVLLRGQDSNLRPIGYTYPYVSIRRGLYHHPRRMEGASQKIYS